MRVVVVGCGLIGRRRAEVVRAAGDDLVAVADTVLERARDVAAGQCESTDDWRALLARPEVEVVVVSTSNNVLSEVSIAALEANKHVLVEKPLGRSVQEAEAMVEMADKHGRVLKTGFNHRFHPGVWKAHELFAKGAIGTPLFARCRYGHGGRPGYENEWRFRKEISGGGEFLDQGIHAIDLVRWFLGDFAEAVGFTENYHYRPGGVATVEDNGFALFRTASGQVATIHASWTQWKNLFSLEIVGESGYLVIDGLGGSYGPEKLTLGHKRPESGPPIEEVFEFPATDVSWSEEWKTFRGAICEGGDLPGDGRDGLAAMRMVAAIYRSVETKCVTPV